jgi:hypothetical protein
MGKEAFSSLFLHGASAQKLFFLFLNLLKDFRPKIFI